MNTFEHFVRIDFHRFKAFERFSLLLRHFNILVGPNNAGKSTILTAIRILASAMRKALARKPEMVKGPNGITHGYNIDLRGVSVAEENIFYNYNDAQPATVIFTLSNGNILTLYFCESASCILIAETSGVVPKSPSAFQKHFNCPIGFVPILGPVEHNEPLYQEEAARSALFNYTAARNFRNIWYHYPEHFSEFRSLLQETWPGMDIEAPAVDNTHVKPRLHMFCPEERIPREIFWSGFGFQVWSQMLTHLVQSRNKSLFLIDEPDIYLHADLQRQLLSLLRNLGPDIIIATHSTEMITEAETDDIVIINKKRKSARRIKQPAELAEVFHILGSDLNPILTQLAKTRRALFVEGKDFQILGRFARKLKCARVGNRAEFAVVPVEGFNPERIRSLKSGMETTLGGQIVAAAILDRDYRSQNECDAITVICKTFCDVVHIHACKEIENFLIVPSAVDRAIASRIADRTKRTGKSPEGVLAASAFFAAYADSKKTYVTSQYLAARRSFEKTNASGRNEATFNEEILAEFESRWKNLGSRFQMIPGKDALSALNTELQSKCGITITPTAIIDLMTADEIPVEVKQLVMNLETFTTMRPGSKKV